MKIYAKSRTISLVIGLVLLTLILPGAVSAYSTSSLNAQVISTTIPSSMVAGQSYPVSVTMKNTGRMTWSEASMIRLGGIGDGSGDAYKFGPALIKIPAGTKVLPGAQYTFTFTMTAPATPGSYFPKYRMVRNGYEWFGAQATKTIQVVSQTAGVPVAQFTASATSGQAPLGVQFTDQSVSTGTTTCAWDVNNDGVVEYTTKSPAHTYTTDGTYTVKLTVTNASGSDSEIKSGYIRVSSLAVTGIAPIAQFTSNITQGTSPLSVQFTDQSVSTGTTTYAWDVNNDGSTDYTTKSPSHTYAAAGNYTVKLTVTDDTGSDSEIKSDYIKVTSLGIVSVPSSALYLTDFGIKGDGSDETAKLKSAFDYAATHSIKTVIFPAGKTIGLNNYVETPENMEYIGNGCTIKLINNAAINHEMCFIYFHAGSYVHNLIFDGNDANQGGTSTNGIMLYTNDRFEDNEVKNIGAYSVYTYKGDNILINNNTIHDSRQYGIGTSGEGFPVVNDYSNNITITNNILYNCGQVGIKIRQTSNSLVKGNIITVPTSRYDDAPTGIRLYSFDGANNHITITNNQINAPGAGSIAISSDNSANSYISITNNQITNANTGIKIAFNNGIITGNSITYRSTCIANGGSGNTVSGNTCN